MKSMIDFSDDVLFMILAYKLTSSAECEQHLNSRNRIARTQNTRPYKSIYRTHVQPKCSLLAVISPEII